MPTLKRDDWVIIDNLTAYCVAGMRKLTEAAGDPAIPFRDAPCERPADESVQKRTRLHGHGFIIASWIESRILVLPAAQLWPGAAQHVAIIPACSL